MTTLNNHNYMAQTINIERQCWNCNKAELKPGTLTIQGCRKFRKKHVYDSRPGCSQHAYNRDAISDKTGDPELDDEVEINRRSLTNHRNRWYERYRNRQDTALTQDEIDWNDE